MRHSKHLHKPWKYHSKYSCYIGPFSYYIGHFLQCCKRPCFLLVDRQQYHSHLSFYSKTNKKGYFSFFECLIRNEGIAIVILQKKKVLAFYIFLYISLHPCIYAMYVEVYFSIFEEYTSCLISFFFITSI